MSKESENVEVQGDSIREKALNTLIQFPAGITADEIANKIGVKRNSIYAAINGVRKTHGIDFKGTKYFYRGQKTAGVKEKRQYTRHIKTLPMLPNNPTDLGINKEDILCLHPSQRTDFYDAVWKWYFYGMASKAFIEASKKLRSFKKEVGDIE
jgi:hypothetical protein